MTASYADHAELASANAALRTFGTDLLMAAGCAGTDLVNNPESLTYCFDPAAAGVLTIGAA